MRSLTCWANYALVDAPDTVGVDLALLAGLGSLVGVEAWAAVLTLGSSGVASEADVARGLAAHGARGASGVGERSVGTSLAAVTVNVQRLAASALVAGDGTLDGVVGAVGAIFTGR